MAVKKLRFMWLNHFDSAVVTASSEAADYPVAMLQNRWRDAECGWRSVGVAAGEWVIADLGAEWATKPVQAFVLENMNFTAGMTVELGGHASDPTAEEHTTYENLITITAAMAAAKRIVIFLAAVETYRWWRFRMSAGGGGLSYLSASRPYIGPYFEPERSYRTQWKRWPESGSVINYSDGGQASATKRPIFWNYELPVSIVGAADALAYAAIDTECGIEKPLWICIDTTDEIAGTVYGHFLEYIPFPSTIDGRLWETTLLFREEL
jgi:hypothetical protein